MTILKVPAVCRTCGLVFASGMAAGMGVGLTLQGNMTRCPRCGNEAQIPDAILEVIRDGIRLFSASDFTKEIYEGLGLIVEDLRSGRISKKVAIERASQLNPKLGKQFREWASLGLAFIGVMFAMGSFILDYLAQSNSNRILEEVAVDAIHSAYEETQPVDRPDLSWGKYFSSPKVKSSDFRPADQNGLNRKQRRAAASKKK